MVSVGQFHGGVRNNIIPDRGAGGTIRTFDDAMQSDIHKRVGEIAEGVAAGDGAKVTVTILRGYPVTINDPALTARMLPTLERVAGHGRVRSSRTKVTGAEDFTYYQRPAPGLFVLLGVTPEDEQATAAPTIRRCSSRTRRAPGFRGPRADLPRARLPLRDANRVGERMELEVGPRYASFRPGGPGLPLVRHRDAAPAAGVGAMRDGRVLAWQQRLVEHGYAGRTVPREYGGFGAAPDALARRT